MLIYKLYLRQMQNQVDAAVVNNENGTTTSFIFDPNVIAYEQFKYAINNEQALLENVDGVLMTPEEAKIYVQSLP